MVKYGQMTWPDAGEVCIDENHTKAGDYSPVFDENKVGGVADIALTNGHVVAVARSHAAEGIRMLQVKPATAQTFLSYIAREGAGVALAGPGEDRFGIGGIEQGQ